MNIIQEIKNTLELEAHPEGGFYKRIYASKNQIHTASGEIREAITGIYFLMHQDHFSAFHRLDADETWHYYEGNTGITIHCISPKGKYYQLSVNSKNRQYSCIVPAGTWFASGCNDTQKNNYALVGCNVAPGFEFRHFEMANREDLSAAYPEHIDIIQQFTRELSNKNN